MRTVSGTLLLTAIAALALAGSLSSAVRAEVTVESTVDRTEITIGDFITYTVHVRYSPEVRLIGDPLSVELQPFEIIDASSATDETPEGDLGARYTYRISVYETGEHKVPPYVLRYATPDGQEREARSHEHTVVVHSVATDLEAAEDIRDLKDPLVLGLPVWKRFGFWLLIVLALIVLVALGLRLRRRLLRHAVERPAKGSPPRLAHEIAYEALTALRQDEEGLLRRKEFEPFSVRISTIQREYLLNRYGLLALDRTTEEILEALSVLALESRSEEGFREFFDDCDLVKFARETLEQSDMLYLIDLAWRLVDETRAPNTDAKHQETEIKAPSEPGASPVKDRESRG